MSINPILAALNQNKATTPNIKPQLNNPLALISEFAKFKKSFADKDPQAVLEQLLSSGQMSQEQFAELKSTAEGLLSILS